MIRKENGLTLTVLIFTVVIMLILATVVININTSLNKTVDFKGIIANMEIIRSKASQYKDYVEKIETSTPDDEKEAIFKNFPGIPTDIRDSTMLSQIITKSGKDATAVAYSYYWFELDQGALNKLGVDINLKQDKKIYLVNYETLDVVFCYNNENARTSPKGIKTKTLPNDVYFYDTLKTLKVDEVSD